MSLWSRAEMRTAASTGAVGVMILGWAWWEASGSADLDTQTGWVVVGVLGVIVVLKALFSWVRDGRRRVRVRREDFIRAFDESPFGLVSIGSPVVALEGVVVLAGSDRYHRADCLLVQGKRAKPLRGAPSQRQQECEMCQPSVDAESSR